MIVSFLVLAVLGLVGGALGLLPSLTFPNPQNFGAEVHGYAQSANAVFPIDAFLLAASTALAYTVALAAINALLWAYHQFWGSE